MYGFNVFTDSAECAVCVLQTRGTEKRRLLEEQIQVESWREEAARLPRANPLPWTLDERQVGPQNQSLRLAQLVNFSPFFFFLVMF